jgi:meso-butanediol dehydrogenase / (S,S)-butanediol dehydrogenase / diacetyl reductase
MGERLKGKIALISGTGRAAARLFAAEGASVVGTDIDEDAAKATASSLRRTASR